MKRVVLLIAVTLLCVVALALPAFAAIHPIASSVRWRLEHIRANTQDPPGQLALGGIAPNTPIPTSGGAALNGNSGASVCPNA